MQKYQFTSEAGPRAPSWYLARGDASKKTDMAEAFRCQRAAEAEPEG